jgi:Flp pilus assembly protein TadD
MKRYRALYSRLLAVGLDEGVFFFNLSKALVAAKRHHDALSAAQNAVIHSPDYGPSHFVLAQLLFRSGDMERAEHHARETIRLKPSAAAFGLLARALDRKGDRDGARAAIDDALALHPESQIFARFRAGLEIGQ